MCNIAHVKLTKISKFYWKQQLFIENLHMKYKMYKFQCKFTTLNFSSYANLHMIEKPLKKILGNNFGGSAPACMYPSCNISVFKVSSILVAWL